MRGKCMSPGRLQQWETGKRAATKVQTHFPEVRDTAGDKDRRVRMLAQTIGSEDHDYANCV